MKRFYTYQLIVILLLSMATTVHGQVSVTNQIVAWQFARGYSGPSDNSTGQETTMNSTTTNSNLEISVLKRGAGATVPTGGNTRSFNASFPNAGSKSDAQLNNRYFEFSIQTKTGYRVSLSALRVVLRRLATSPNYYRWAYSVNETGKLESAKIFTEIGSSDINHNLTNANGDLQAELDLSAITALQNVAVDSLVTLRLYAWGATVANASFAIGKSNNNDGTGGSNNIALAVGGTVSSSVNPFSPFEPWDEVAWANHYDGTGKLLKPFELDRNVDFGVRPTPWQPEFASTYSGTYLFKIAKQGIQVNGKGVDIDVRLAARNEPLADLYGDGATPWTDGTTLNAIYHALNEQVGTGRTLVKNLTVKGFNRGMVFTNTAFAHPIMLDSCTFIRNTFALYFNGQTNAIIQHCNIIENGYGGVYSGSKSQGNIFRYNLFRDNMISQNQPSYGELIGDTFFDTQIRKNTFAKSLVTNSSLSHIGISIFRNAGEDNNLREKIPHNLVIDSNTFDGYSIGIHVASRMGRYPSYDISKEGRDYAFYNQIKKNDFVDCSIGIKINSEGNTIDGNTFTNTTYQIVLHPVFFRLTNTTINNQSGNTVHVWYVKANYSTVPNQAFLFNFHDDANSFILRSEKRVEVFSTTGTPTFTAAGGIDTAEFKLNPTPPLDVLWDHRVGNPSVKKYGEFQQDLAGDEVVAIWNNKISRIGNVDYYSIIIFDQNGTEINRCGRSEVGWSQLAVGYFVRTSGEMEIAAVPKAAIDGKYPVYIFSRGYAEPTTILYPDNTDPTIQIDTDPSHHLVVTFGESLSLEQLSLKAKPDAFGSSVNLMWKATNSKNAKEYVVEKKSGTKEFAVIGSQKSINAAGVQDYQFLDKNIIAGLAYYRVKQINQNGAYKYSSIITVKSNEHFNFFPNPAGNKLTVNFGLTTSTALIRVRSVDGREMIKQQVGIGSSGADLDISNLTTGTYMLVFEHAGEKSVLKFIKK